MTKLLVNGGVSLNGEITPSGSKNAALPIIFSTLITKGISTIKNVPDITDVDRAISLIEAFGARVTRIGNVLTVDTRVLHYTKPNEDTVSSLRASSYLLGACLSRFGVFNLSEFGGCNFCNRPIDMHLDAAKCFGAMIDGDLIYADELCGAKIHLKKRSVGATVNALIMAACAHGESEITGAANEPHVKNLVQYLCSAGASVELSNSTIKVYGGSLHGGTVTLVPDMIEAGTYMLLGALLGGRIYVKGFGDLELEKFAEPYLRSGYEMVERDGCHAMIGRSKVKITVKTAPHPGYPTDLQPLAAPIMAANLGGTIMENVWESRFSYLNSLSSFGIECDVFSARASILSSNIRNGKSIAPDLRGGASVLMCALYAHGESEISNAELILRGYSDIWNKLKSLGANIEVIKKEN